MYCLVQSQPTSGARTHLCRRRKHPGLPSGVDILIWSRISNLTGNDAVKISLFLQASTCAVSKVLGGPFVNVMFRHIGMDLLTPSRFKTRLKYLHQFSVESFCRFHYPSDLPTNDLMHMFVRNPRKHLPQCSCRGCRVHKSTLQLPQRWLQLGFSRPGMHWAFNQPACKKLGVMRCVGLHLAHICNIYIYYIYILTASYCNYLQIKQKIMTTLPAAGSTCLLCKS